MRSKAIFGRFGVLITPYEVALAPNMDNAVECILEVCKEHNIGWKSEWALYVNHVDYYDVRMQWASRASDPGATSSTVMYYGIPVYVDENVPANSVFYGLPGCSIDLLNEWKKHNEK